MSVNWYRDEWRRLRAMSIPELKDRISYLKKAITQLPDKVQELGPESCSELESAFIRDIEWATEVLIERGKNQ